MDGPRNGGFAIAVCVHPPVKGDRPLRQRRCTIFSRQNGAVFVRRWQSTGQCSHVIGRRLGSASVSAASAQTPHSMTTRPSSKAVLRINSHTTCRPIASSAISRRACCRTRSSRWIGDGLRSTLSGRTIRLRLAIRSAAFRINHGCRRRRACGSRGDSRRRRGPVNTCRTSAGFPSCCWSSSTRASAERAPFAG